MVDVTNLAVAATRRPSKSILIGVATVVVLLLIWWIWPSGKPPEACQAGDQPGIRPGQVVPDFRANGVLKIMGSNCKLPAQAATPDEIKAAQERMAKWQAVERENSPDMLGGATAQGSMFGAFFAAFPWWAKPIIVVAGIWLVLFGVAMAMFFLGFVVVAVFGLRHAPLLVIAAPIMIWWKVLIEMPKGLALQFIDLTLSKAEAGKVQTMALKSMLQLFGIRRMQPNETESLGDLGSAAFGSFADVQAKDSPGAHRAPVPIGQLNGQPLSWHTDKHVFILAGTRAGKGRSIIIPNLLSYEGSVFVIDPKAENFEKSYRYRSKHGPVRVLDPWGRTSLSAAVRARFNPLALLLKDNPESVDIADVLAHGLVLQTSGDTYWSDSARALWKALLLHVATDPEFEGARDLITARQILLTGFLPAKKDQVAKEDQAAKPHTPSTIERMIENKAFDEIIADFAMSLLATPERERGSIISNASRQTDFLDTPALRASLAADGEGKLIDFSEWRRGVMSCYVCIPADKLEGSGLRWVRMVVSAALNEMTKEEKPPVLPVQFILDELASLKRLEPVERAIGLAAGYGVQIWSIWQDISQIKDLYNARWSSFIGNAGARYIFGVGDYDTAKYFSDYIGQTTRMVTAQQADALGLRLSGQSRSVQTRALMTPDEIMLMEPREMLVLLDKIRPLKANRQGWDEDPILRARSETGTA